MSLETLLAEMTAFQSGEAEMAKAQPLPDDSDGDEDDEDIAVAAAQANADNADQELGGDEDEDEDEEGAEDAALGKSFSFETEDGQQIQAFDATDLVKSLTAEISALRTESTGVMQQAFGLIKSQAAEIAGLKAQVQELGSAGRGRKALVSVTQKAAAATFAKSHSSEEPEGLSKSEFFAKAATAHRAGRISAADISVAEAYMSKGMPVPERIVSRVIGG